MTVLRAVGARFTWRRLPGGLNRLSEIGVSPSDSEELSVRKAVLVLSSTLMATLSFVWVATYAALGLWLSAAIPFAALQTFLAATQAFARTRRYRLFRRSQPWMSLLLPFARSRASVASGPPRPCRRYPAKRRSAASSVCYSTPQPETPRSGPRSWARQRPPRTR